ncbi:MAG: IS256 family transposase [Chlamydiia bacterium]|nr:IS256 family transposase [Chlamydiia bacterium]
MEKHREILEKSVVNFLAYTGKDLNDAIRVMFNTVMDLERDAFLGYAKRCRADKTTENKRNGYVRSLIDGLNDSFIIKIPRDRLNNFKPFLLELIKKERTKMDSVCFKLYTKGLTTRDIESVFQELYKSNYSKSSISRIISGFTEERKKWQARPLDNEYLIVYIDALRQSVRRYTSSKEAVYVVMGLKPDLTRDILGIWTFPEETKAGWEMVLKDLKARGVNKVLCFVADGFNGLKDVINNVYPTSDMQRCIVHKIRNILALLRYQDRAEVAADFKKVYILEDKDFTVEKGKELLDDFLAKWSKKYKKLKGLFPEDEIENLFAYSKYPVKIQRMIYTTNWIEAINKQIRRTTKIRGSFPDEDSMLNLISAYIIDRCDNNYNKYPITSLIPVKEELAEMLRKR